MRIKNEHLRVRYFLFFFLMLALASLACQTIFGGDEGDSTEDTAAVEVVRTAVRPSDDSAIPEDAEVTAEAAALAEVAAPAVEDSTTSEPGAGEEAADSEQQPEATEAARPTKTAQEGVADRVQAGVEALSLGQIGFIQDPETGEVAYALHLENPNTDIGFEDSEYTVAFYDENGTVLETDFGYVDLVLPSEKTAIAGGVWLDEGLTAAEIEVQLKTGDALVPETIPDIAADSTRYFADDFSEWGTAVLHNNSDVYVEDIIVSFVTYDQDGNISGSGYTYSDWIYPHDSMGVEVYLVTNGEVDDVRVYPRISPFSLEPIYGAKPDDALEVDLLDSGHVLADDLLVYGFTVGNPNENYAIESSRYAVTAYTGDGSVLFVNSGYLDLIPPGGRVVNGSYEFLESLEAVDHIDYKLRAGEYIESEPLPPFVGENAAYIGDDFSPTVTGEVVNPFDWDLEDVTVWAVLRDAEGAFIGGGSTYLSFVPANGSAAVEIYVDGLPDPASIELIPVLTYFEETLPPD